MRVIELQNAIAVLEKGIEELRDGEQWDAQGIVTPYDGKPALRPHSIAGWWQVWSGGLCIALLSPEDVAPLTEELRGRLRNAEDALRERIEPRRGSPNKSESKKGTEK